MPKTHRFLRYSTCKYTVTLKPGLGVTQGHRNYDFLLMFHMGLCRTVSEINGDLETVHCRLIVTVDHRLRIRDFCV